MRRSLTTVTPPGQGIALRVAAAAAVAAAGAAVLSVSASSAQDRDAPGDAAAAASGAFVFDFGAAPAEPAAAPTASGAQAGNDAAAAGDDDEADGGAFSFEIEAGAGDGLGEGGPEARRGSPHSAAPGDADWHHAKLMLKDRFPSAAACGQCHPTQYREWSVSSHAYAQLSPVFNAMQGKITQLTAGTNGDFCIRCHTQVGMQEGEPTFTSNLVRTAIAREGVTCVVCHRMGRSYGKVSGRTAVREGDIKDPIYGPTGAANLKKVLSDASFRVSSGRGIHRDAIKFQPISSPGFCGACHDVNSPDGFRLEEAFTQFKNSPAARRGTTCQDCHMGKTPGFPSGYEHRPAARVSGKDTPPRKHASHFFSGPDYSIVHPGIFPHNPEAHALVTEHLKTFAVAAADNRASADFEHLPGGGLRLGEKHYPPAALAAGAVRLDDAFVNLQHWLDFDHRAGWGDPAWENDLRAAAAAAFPPRWRSPTSRREAREILDDQFALLEEARAKRYQLLRRGFQLGALEVLQNDAGGLRFRVAVVNGTDGHGAPTGFDAERLNFLQVTVADAAGEVVFRSGDRDPNGDVRDLHSLYVHAGQAPLDRQLFSLQSRFLLRGVRGGELEEVLAVNRSVDPLPFVRPDTRSAVLTARPRGARKQARVIPPLGSRWAAYNVPARDLAGRPGPFTVRVRFIAQMVPVNLVGAIAGVGFDYGLSPREVARRIVDGAHVLWDRRLTLDPAAGPQTLDLSPSEAEILAPPPLGADPW